MFLPYRRHGLVVALALVTGVTSLTVRPPAHAAALPSIATLINRTGWQVTATYNAPVWQRLSNKQWQLRDPQGDVVYLYLETSAAVQRMVHWSGELSYLGAGYQVVGRAVTSVQMPDGTAIPYSAVTVQRLGDRQVLEYAIVSPDGIAAYATGNPLRTAWDTLRGDSGPYYLVRLSVPGRLGAQGARRAASQLLAPILSTLRAGDHGGVS